MTRLAKAPETHPRCLECGHRFRTRIGALKAMFGADGCPGYVDGERCGSADIDAPDPTEKPAAVAAKGAA